MSYLIQTRKSDTLSVQMNAAATSATLTAGSFGTPTGQQIITIDGDVAAKTADFLCTITNTAVTSMTLLNGPDVVHAAGATVWMGMVDEHYANGLGAIAAGDDWVSYTPSWTGASVNPAIGNGTLDGKYCQVGKSVEGWVRMIAGSTTTFGSGSWFFSLPVTADAVTLVPLGPITIRDASVPTEYWGICRNDTTGRMELLRSGGTTVSNVDSAGPMTWAVNDFIIAHFSYKAA